MSDIDAEPYFREIQTEVFGVVEGVIDEADGNTPASFLGAVEYGLNEIRDAYELTDEELEDLGRVAARRLEVKSVLEQDEKGKSFIRLYILPKENGDEWRA